MRQPEASLTAARLNAQILAQASEWLVELETGDGKPQVRRDFDAWLRQSPDHIRAYLELLPIWSQGARARFARDSGPESLIAYARSEDNVVRFELGNEESDRRLGRRQASDGRKTRGVRWLCAVAACLLIAVGSVLAWTHYSWATYSTGIGEQRSIALADGSMLELNALSKVRTRFTEHTRAIRLIEGQALFEVAKDPARPFIVDVDGTYVRAVGTAFDIHRGSSGTTITVLEGRVAVVPPSVSRETSATSLRMAERNALSSNARAMRSSVERRAGSLGAVSPIGEAPVIADQHRAQADSRARALSTGAKENKVRGDQRGDPVSAPILLYAGEQITVDPLSMLAPPESRRANLAATTAWTQRRLVFDASSLAEVVEEFNRYNRRRLVIRDPELGTFPISAAFSTTDPGSLIRFLEAQPNIEVRVTDEEVLIERR